MIYTRFGDPIKLLRPASEDDVRRHRGDGTVDDHDRQRLEYGMLAFGIYPDSDEERIFDLGALKADNGIVEIHKAARAVGCDPR